MSNVKNDFVMPILVLTVICLITTFALAFTEQLTTPIIDETNKAIAEAARREVLPLADSFEAIEATDLPETVIEAYKASNGTGIVIIAENKGYGGAMRIIVGIDGDGKIVATKTLLSSETAGLGSKMAEPKFQSQFIGKDAALEGVSAVSGATISSNCFIDMVNDALSTYSIVKGEL